MITAIIPTLDSARTLPGLMSDLVPAAVEGLVRQVLVVDAGSTDETLAICEDAGAEVVAAGMVEAVARARGEWLLVLPHDLRLRRGWEEAATLHLQREDRAVLLVDSYETRGWWSRLLRPPKAGVLVKRSALAGREAMLAKLARRAPILRG